MVTYLLGRAMWCRIYWQEQFGDLFIGKGNVVIYWQEQYGDLFIAK